MYLVQSDAELREALHRTTMANRREAAARAVGRGDDQTAARTTSSTS